MLEHLQLPTNPVAENRLTRLQEIRISFPTIYVMLKTLKRWLPTVIDVIHQPCFKWEIEYGSYKVALKPVDLAANWIINVLAHI